MRNILNKLKWGMVTLITFCVLTVCVGGAMIGFIYIFSLPNLLGSMLRFLFVGLAVVLFVISFILTLEDCNKIAHNLFDRKE